MTMSRARLRYNWELWMDGETHTATWNEDFNCSAASLVALLHQKAREAKVTVRTTTVGPNVTFTFGVTSTEEAK